MKKMKNSKTGNKTEVALRPEYRYKTCHVASSPKKLKSLSRQLKNLTLDRAIDLANFSTKGFGKTLHKSLCSIRSNLISVRLVPEAEVKNMLLEKIVVEKVFRVYGHRVRAKGHASSSTKDFCTLNIYIRNNN